MRYIQITQTRSNTMNWTKAVIALKAHMTYQTDKALYEHAGMHGTAIATIKRGTASFVNIEKLCTACKVKPSTFISWGEE